MNPAVGIFDRFADDYDQWFDANNEVYSAQAGYLRRYISGTGNSLEIGVGSGRFASRLGIQHGLDPSPRLLAMARHRGVETILGKGEFLPYRAGTFDCVLMMTVICFMDYMAPTLTESFRVLKAGGTLVIGFFDTNGEIVLREREQKFPGRFLCHARFRSADEVIKAIRCAGFSDVKERQNLHGLCFVTAGNE